MNLARLQQLVRGGATDKTPQWRIATVYGVIAAFGSVGMLAVVSIAPTMLTGRPTRPILAAVPQPWQTILLLLCFVVFGTLGTVCGWSVGKFINSAASDYPKLAVPLLFSVLFFPPACLIATWMLLTLENGIGTPLAYFGVLTAVCAVTSYSYRRSGWPENVPRG